MSLDVRENVPLGPKTTMRIGGTARYFAQVATKEDLAAAQKFAREKNVPFIVLGSGSNTIFDDGTIETMIVRIDHAICEVKENTVRVGSGKNLAMLINELAEKGLDLSALTGIPGTIGGAIFGNAGQGPQGIWISS